MNAPETTNADNITVNQLGDVTERMVLSPLSGDMIPVKPMKSLPKTHKHLAATYPTAMGYTVEDNGNVVFHF